MVHLKFLLLKYFCKFEFYILLILNTIHNTSTWFIKFRSYNNEKTRPNRNCLQILIFYRIVVSVTD